ncbi:hypothetical protein B1R32_10582 [Abditibacterium utsteinense]|uniref:Uncharacterized protein n=1 Tax=Abditibacterium utsteinense TaxID=1960156 RepID=A0A2S8SUC6_9BACT|nr:hypothetical protein [Abditibacterium utsteinense]PQV64401.1 hypothetical protein B1R32_10582 [Abditibacterium utsteinense]
MNRNSSRFLFAPALTLTLCSAVSLNYAAWAQPSSVNQIGASSAGQSSEENSRKGAPANDLSNGISGNVPDAEAADTTYGVNSPGRLIGPAPENGESDPRFPNERDTSSGGDNAGNNKSTAAGSAQAPVPGIGDKSTPGAAQNGGQTSVLNEGLPSAAEENSGGNAGTGSGGPGGAGGNAGGDARRGMSAPQNTQNPGDVGRETLGAAPYAIAGGAVMIGAFLATMLWARAKKNR